ncbi:hypothetical protein ACVWXN_001241 [Bradyrhizobium sp. i1.4.4]
MMSNQRRHVLALDHQLADAAAAGLGLDIGDHAVDDGLGRTVDGDDQHHAQQRRQRAAAGKQEDGAQRRAHRQVERELESALCIARSDLDLGMGQRLQHLARRRHRRRTDLER